VLSISILVQARLTETVATWKSTWLKHKRETYWALGINLLIISSTEYKAVLIMIAFLKIGNSFSFHDSTSFNFKFEIIIVLSGLSGHKT
jgi:hypothetical protein